MLHLSTVTVMAALFLANLVHAEDLLGASSSVPYFLFNVRTSSLSSRDVLSHGIAKCLGLDDTSSDPFRSYSTHTLDASTVVTIQFEEAKYANSMLEFISTVNSTDAAITFLHENCNNLIINSIVASYNTDVVPTTDGSNFFSEHPYVFVGGGAAVLMLSIVIIVVIIKRKEKREKDEYIEPLSSMEQGRVGPHPRQRQANDVGRPGQRPVIHQAKVVTSTTPNTTQKAPQPRQLQTSAPQQQEVVPEAAPQVVAEDVPPPPTHNGGASLN